jgi:hypothetical protein
MVLASDLVAPWGVLAAGAGLAAVVAVFVGVALEVAFPVHEAGQALALARLRVALALSGHARTVDFARVAEIASAARTVAQQPLPAQQQVALCAIQTWIFELTDRSRILKLLYFVYILIHLK